MFGLKAIFAAMARLAAAVNRSADLFEAANEQLAARLGFDEAPPALEQHGGAEDEEGVKPAKRNGRK